MTTGGPAPGHPALHVLVVDDVADFRHLLRLSLEGNGRFAVVGEAGDGARAVQQAAELQPDLILLDLVMPRPNGFETLPRLREVAPHARVVVLSALDNRALESEVRSLGAVGYLDKGLSPEELRRGLLAVAGTLEAVEAGVAEARSRLAAEVESAGSARRFVETTLRGWDSGQPLDVIKLLVSELVTNAVLHAHSPPEVTVQLRRDTVRVEVMDASSSLPVVRKAASYDTSGRGMALVETLSSAWGAEPRPGGKVVWFEVPRTETGA